MILTERQRVNFFKKFIKGSTDGCWEWLGAKSNEYGIFWLNKNQLAHRVSYELFNGPVPEGIQVLHKCDNHSCINPNHLFLGTQKDNIQDCLKKGRKGNMGKHAHHACGERNGQYGKDNSGNKNGMYGKGYLLKGKRNGAKLSLDNIKEIRNSKMKAKELAQKFGVTDSCIYIYKQIRNQIDTKEVRNVI